MISVNNLTLTYPSGKGVFDLNFLVEQGEVMGYLGPNGAGKTTTIRALLGFMKPNNGTCMIGGRDCIQKAPEIQKTLGYIPGEISFLDMDGDEFLKFMQDMRGVKDNSRQRQLLDLFELQPKGKIRKFSKGMKQKLSIVTAFMHDPQVLVLDEPTSGLDPLMQNRFVDLILQEKTRGKTILMSSHSFEEVERTCDNALIIREGRIIEQSDVQTLKGAQRKGYLIKPADMSMAGNRLKQAGFDVAVTAGDTLEVYITGEQVDRLLKILAQQTILDIDVKTQTLEDVFMKFYGREE
ncbi:MAG: ABC transporter ATP-binding protein [Bacillota bacterium]|nr:ABC transporter ATP-binding protein [Bacillota bacterium]